jgi:hypothetical protein
MAKQLTYKGQYPLNRGDFYTENGSCTVCGAPQAEAPDLIEHAKVDGHCYFRRQPVTETDIDQAIAAMQVSCVGALRYGGTDEGILKRLYENGMAELCDNKPQQHYPVVIRNRVSFIYNGPFQEMVEELKTYLLQINKNFTITDESRDLQGVFRFIQRWYPNVPGTMYEVRESGPQEMNISVRQEQGKADETVGRSWSVHDFLQQNMLISRIQWKADDPGNTIIYEKPF